MSILEHSGAKSHEGKECLYRVLDLYPSLAGLVHTIVSKRGTHSEARKGEKGRWRKKRRQWKKIKEEGEVVEEEEGRRGGSGSPGEEEEEGRRWSDRGVSVAKPYRRRTMGNRKAGDDGRQWSSIRGDGKVTRRENHKFRLNKVFTFLMDHIKAPKIGVLGLGE